ncbi:hypothetical protein CFP56_004800 [Quercus suber]|uniref:Uncharacterized protein n=1 Tax=Quercus suber TaxID=58331 RepID=A0AAW0MAA3_QUESU
MVCYFVMLWSNFIEKWRDKDIRRGRGNKPLTGISPDEELVCLITKSIRDIKLTIQVNYHILAESCSSSKIKRAKQILLQGSLWSGDNRNFTGHGGLQCGQAPFLFLKDYNNVGLAKTGSNF